MSQYLIVADESVDFRIVLFLRSLGCEVYSISEKNPSITDVEVLALAVEKKALLITEDKDFGELVFRLRLLHNGILLIRILSLPVEGKLKLISGAIMKNYAQLIGVFSVLSDSTLRIKQ